MLPPFHAGRFADLRRGAGRPLVLVHGLGSSLRTWDLVAPALAEQREVVAWTCPARVPAVRAGPHRHAYRRRHPVSRTALVAQFSHRRRELEPSLTLRELRGVDHSPLLDQALRALVAGPRRQGAPAGTLQGRVVIGWGRNDKVTLPSQGRRAMGLFPEASLHWFEGCGHFPPWDRPEQTVQLILQRTT